MANKKGVQPPKRINNYVPKQVIVQKTQSINRPTAEQDSNSFVKKYADVLIATGIALVTFLFLKTCLANQFTNWDDNGYLTNDPLIKDVSAEGIRHIFSVTHPVDGSVMGNYHPLTILTYAIEYSYKGLEPFTYHFDNLILHLLTTVSVYLFVKVLSRRTVAAAVTALLFGIHPMHVESVAWAAGRKDVLYGLFYMLSLVSYVWYLRSAGSKKIGWYVAMLVLFVCALLAKPVAVTLPVVLFLIDYFEKRKIDPWLFIDKIPGFALSIAFGLLSVAAQKKVGAYDKLDITFTKLEHVALGSYALCTYLWKAIVPVGLANYYPYSPMPDGHLPGSFYIYPVIVLAIIGAVAALGRRNKVVVFGTGFFIVNIILLLQFIPVGSAIIADRYTYLPYIGLFFMLGWWVSNYFETSKKVQTGKVILGAVVVYSIVLGFASSERCKVWYDSITLWRDEVDKHPESPNGFNNLGAIYSDMMPAAQTPQEREKDYDSSKYFLQNAIAINPKFISSIICLGILERTHGGPGEIDSAKATLLKAEHIDDKDAAVYLELGVIYSIKHVYDSAEYCFRNAITLRPFFPEAYSNFANFYDITGKIDSSLKEYAIAIQQNPDAYIPYLNRARIYTRQGKFAEAMKDFEMAVQKSPEMAEIYYSRSQCYSKMGNKALALQDLNKSIALGYTQVDKNYVQQLKN
jgi:Flp pilus assembly protein TadD